MNEQPRHEVHSTVAKGAGMMIALRLADRLISVVSFSVLARLLTPVDYGIFALALSVVGIIAAVGDLNVESAVVQRRGFDRGHYDTAWTLRLVSGALVGLVICIAAVPAARIFAEPRIEPALYWLALATAISGFENIGTVDFLKTLAYRRELIYRLTVRVVITATAILLALVWRSYWALVAAQVVANALGVAISYRMHPFRPRLSLSHVSGLFRFTRWLYLRNLFINTNDQVAQMVLARGVGVAQLSFYTFARDLALIVFSDFYAPVVRALFPAYASASHDPAALRRLTIDSSALMVLIGVPMSAGLAVVAPDVIRVLLGDRWLDVIPVLQILCISGCLAAGTASAQMLYVAMGRPDTAAKLAGFRFFLVLILIAIGVNIAGTVGAAWAIAATSFITQAVNWRILGSSVGLSFGEMGRECVRPIAASAFMALVVLTLENALPEAQTFASSLLRLVACTLTGAFTYAVALFGSWRLAGKPDGAERHLLTIIAATAKRLAVPPFRTSRPSR